MAPHDSDVIKACDGRTKYSLAKQMLQIQQERDQLAAQLGRVLGVIDYSGVYKDCQALADVLHETPAQSLAEHDKGVRAALTKALVSSVGILYRSHIEGVCALIENSQHPKQQEQNNGQSNENP